MRAYQATGAGGVEIVEVAEPTAGADQAVVEVSAFSVNRGEVNQLRTAAPGWRPGWDVAGRVVAAAANGSGPKAGCRVVGWVSGGAWSQRVAVAVDQLAALPDAISDETAAAMPVAGITARRVLALAGEELRDKRVFVTGGAGGVGSYAVALAAHAGAEVHASAHGIVRSGYARSLGARLVVESIVDGADEYDVILESAGGPFLAEALRRISPGGTVVSFGNSSRSVTSLNIADFYRRTRASMVAFALVAEDAHGFGADLEGLCRQAAAGEFAEIRVSARSWTDLPAALEELENRSVSGKSVCLVDPGSR